LAGDAARLRQQIIDATTIPAEYAPPNRPRPLTKSERTQVEMGFDAPASRAPKGAEISTSLPEGSPFVMQGPKFTVTESGPVTTWKLLDGKWQKVAETGPRSTHQVGLDGKVREVSRDPGQRTVWKADSPGVTLGSGLDIAEALRSILPKAKIKFDGIFDRSALNKGPLYQFTPQEGSMKGRTVAVDELSTKAVMDKLQEVGGPGVTLGSGIPLDLGVLKSLFGKAPKATSLINRLTNQGVSPIDLKMSGLMAFLREKKHSKVPLEDVVKQAEDYTPGVRKTVLGEPDGTPAKHSIHGDYTDDPTYREIVYQLDPDGPSRYFEGHWDGTGTSKNAWAHRRQTEKLPEQIELQNRVIRANDKIADLQNSLNAIWNETKDAKILHAKYKDAGIKIVQDPDTGALSIRSQHYIKKYLQDDFQAMIDINTLEYDVTVKRRVHKYERLIRKAQVELAEAQKKLKVFADTNRLHVDELQGKWFDQSSATKTEVSKIERHVEQYRKDYAKYEPFYEKYAHYLNEDGSMSQAIRRQMQRDGISRENIQKLDMAIGVKRNLERFQQQLDRLKHDAPPFGSNWYKLVLRDVVSDAVNSGKDVISWSGAKVHHVRWPRVKTDFTGLYDNAIPKFFKSEFGVKAKAVKNADGAIVRWEVPVTEKMIRQYKDQPVFKSAGVELRATLGELTLDPVVRKHTPRVTGALS